MTLEAIAAVKIPPSEVRKVKEKLASSGHRVVALADGAAVHLGLKLTEASGGQLVARLRELLGDLLDQHDHPRGVPVYPASYAPDVTTFDALVEELGEGADWVALDAGDAEQDPMAAAAGLLGEAGVDLEALQRQMASGDPNALMESAMGLAQQLADSGKLGEMQQAMAGMLGGRDPREMLAQSGIDVAALEQQVATMDAATLQQLGVSPEQMRQALQETGGDPRAALEKLGVRVEEPGDDDDADAT